MDRCINYCYKSQQASPHLRPDSCWNTRTLKNNGILLL
uniref:Uncharacterized protein n=1 Tax=Anguilla anguilla TaxID=7936 RepID=A0A0E9W859_ANGAN